MCYRSLRDSRALSPLICKISEQERGGLFFRLCSNMRPAVVWVQSRRFSSNHQWIWVVRVRIVSFLVGKWFGPFWAALFPGPFLPALARAGLPETNFQVVIVQCHDSGFIDLTQ